MQIQIDDDLLGWLYFALGVATRHAAIIDERYVANRLAEVFVTLSRQTENTERATKCT